MPTIAARRVLPIVALAWCVRLTLAQPTTSSAPALTFVRGGSHVKEERWGGFPGVGRAQVAATLQTRPALAAVAEGNRFQIGREIMSNALLHVFGPQGLTRPTAPGGAGTDFDALYLPGSNAGIERKTVVLDNGPGGDYWVILAGTEEDAQLLVEALLRDFPTAVSAGLEQARQELARREAQVEPQRRALAEYEQQIQQREDTCRTAGVAEMTDEAIDSAVARFSQEQRLNEVDIAGLEASLASAKQRTGSGELSPTLARIQVELEIQLVGKLARKEALARELQALQTGRIARGSIRELQQKVADVKKWLERAEHNLARSQEQVAALESLLSFTVVDNRVELGFIYPSGTR